MGRKPRLSDPDLYAIAAAYLKAQGQSQEMIALALRISQSAVCRLLDRPLAKQCLTVPAPTFRCPPEKEEVWCRAQAQFFPATQLLDPLRDRCRKRPSSLQKVVTIHGPPEGGFGPAIVPAIQEVIARASIVGITWGRTIGGLIATLRTHLAAPLRPDTPVTIFPLCGEPLQDRGDPLRYSSSALAAHLDELVNGPRHEAPVSLAGVPTFIPRHDFGEKDTGTIRRFISLFAGYSRVFGDRRRGKRNKALVHQADTVITSVGVAEGTRRGIFLTERVELGDLTEDELLGWVVGDIGGVMVPRRTLTPAAAAAVRDMNARWTGISEEELRTCAGRAVREQRPGVVVLAVEARRVDMVLRIAEENLVSQLIIDRPLAEGLHARLDSAAGD